MYWVYDFQQDIGIQLSLAEIQAQTAPFRKRKHFEEQAFKTRGWMCGKTKQ